MPDIQERQKPIPGRIAEVIKKRNERKAKFAVFAQSIGIPVNRIFEIGSYLLKEPCLQCQEIWNVLQRIDELGEEKAEELIIRLLEAKDNNDLEALELIKEECRKL